MNNPVVSILMPIKNYAHYLPQCLSSILQQTFTNWELIAINDHSSDNTSQILRAFAKQDPRIRPLPNEGQGIIPALRTALKHSRGYYITRMDADDLMPPQKLQHLLETLQLHGPQHVATGFVSYFADKNKRVGPGYSRYAEWLNKLTQKKQNYQQIYRECTIPSPAWMCSRQDLLKAGAFKPETYPEDYDLCFRFYQAKLKIAPITKIIHLWRDHDQRISRNDPNYADNAFLHLKVPYFLKLDYQAQRPLVLYGAGKKGKRIAAMLNQHHIPFFWLCNRPGKWGKSMYNTPWQPPNTINSLNNPQIILALADTQGQNEVQKLLHLHQRTEGQDFFWFC